MQQMKYNTNGCFHKATHGSKLQKLNAATVKLILCKKVRN